MTWSCFDDARRAFGTDEDLLFVSLRAKDFDVDARDGSREFVFVLYMNEKRRSYARNTSCDSTNANHCGLLCLPTAPPTVEARGRFSSPTASHACRRARARLGFRGRVPRKVRRARLRVAHDVPNLVLHGCGRSTDAVDDETRPAAPLDVLADVNPRVSLRPSSHRSRRTRATRTVVTRTARPPRAPIEDSRPRTSARGRRHGLASARPDGAAPRARFVHQRRRARLGLDDARTRVTALTKSNVEFAEHSSVNAR